ncbi:MAG: MATE family efflux transporter [Ruminococcaceae bacterium]|nr:MATE family efflux transporter [Oscillospiraceae bacterium]
MTKGPFLKKILIFSLPLMLTGLLQMVYNTADIVVVGRFAGSEALAAVGATSSLINLILNVFLGMAMGSGVMSARYIGAEDDNRLEKCIHTALLLGLISGVAVGIFGFCMAEKLLILMDSPADVLPLSKKYLQIYFLGAPASLVYNFGAAIVRSTGDTKRPLYILSATGIVNIVLNLVLVIVFKLNVAGVAIATIVAQYISAVLIIIRLLKFDGACRLHFSKLRINAREMKKILLIGVPAGVQNSLFSFSNVIIQSTVNSFGSTVMSGVTAASNVEGIVYTCTNAISQTTMTFSSQNMGARKYENIGKIYMRCLLLSALIGGGLCLFGVIFKNQAIGIFSADPAVIKIGAERLAIVLPFHVLCSLMDVGGGQLRGMGRSFEPMIITLLGSCGIRLLWVFVFFPKNPTLTYLYMTYPVSWSITFFVLFIAYFIIKRNILKKERYV